MPAIVRWDQNITTHKFRLLREGQLTKHQGKGLRPMAGAHNVHGGCAGAVTGNVDT